MDWTTPGPQEVALGVHRIPLPLPSDGLHAVNVYAITDGERTTLIDGGWKIDAAREALGSALAVIGVKLQDIERCLVTHHHRDHYTLAVELRRRSGLILALGKGERANIEAARKPRRSFSAQRDLLRTAGAFSVLAAIDAMAAEAIDPQDYELPDIWLDDGDQVDLGDRTLLVRATPGHTAGHVVFVDESANLLFAGDHILPHITPSIGFQAIAAETPLADYLSSLAVVLAEPDRLGRPRRIGHGVPHGVGPALDTSGTPFRGARPLQPDVGGHRDRGAPRCAGGAGPSHSRMTTACGRTRSPDVEPE